MPPSRDEWLFFAIMAAFLLPLPIMALIDLVVVLFKRSRRR